MCLTLGTCCRHLHIVEEERLMIRHYIQRRFQIEGYGELAVLIRLSLSVFYLFVLHHWIRPPPQTPWEVGPTDNTIRIFHVIKSKAGICIHTAMDSDILFKFILLFRLLERYFESWTFIFLHSNMRTTIVGPQIKLSVKKICWNDKRAAI